MPGILAEIRQVEMSLASSWDPWLMPENAGVDAEGPRAARSPRGLIFVAVLAVTIGLAVAVSTLGGTSTQPPPRTPTTEITTSPDSTATPQIRRETVLPTIGALALGGHHGAVFLTRSDPGAVNGAWTVVVRRTDGSLGQRGAVVTYPAHTSDFTDTGAPVRVGTLTGIAGRGFILWPLGNGHARIRGDLPAADLLRIAELTTVAAGRPHVRPPEGFRVIAVGPSRLPLIHEIRYGSNELALGLALGDGLTYTGLTSGGGFEDALYAAGATPAGIVQGVPAVVSSVQGGNGTLAWETSPGVVAYVGWSGAEMSPNTVAALRTLAQGAHLLTPRQWLATKPDLNEQENNPAN